MYIEKIFRKSLALAISLVLSIGVFGSVTASAQDRRITCESSFNGYNYCRVDTDNEVRLVRQLSSSYCDKGSSWGYDHHGIWVDRGCRAEFEYGKTSKTGAIVAGSILGGAILAAILVNSSNKNKQENKNGNTYEQSIETAPNWLVGTYRGYEGSSYTDITIYPDGRVWTGGSGKMSNSSGTYYNGALLIGGETYTITWQGDGFDLKRGKKAAVFYERVN